MSTDVFVHGLIRLQFGLSAGFHFLFVPLSLGLLLCICLLQTQYALHQRPGALKAARFLVRFFVVTWAVGIATGYPLRWQLQGEWGRYTQSAAPVLREIFAIEGAIAPLMLAGVLALAVGRRWIGPRVLACVSWGLLAVMAVQAWTILSVNAWMQHPVGVDFAASGWRLQSLQAVLFSQTALDKFVHTWAASVLVGAFFVLALCAVFVLRGRHADTVEALVPLAAWMAFGASIVAALSGHASAHHVAEVQPMKFAAFEAHWRAEPGLAPLVLVGLPDEAAGHNRHEVSLPGLMSLLAGRQDAPPGLLDLTDQARADVARALAQPDAPGSAGWLALHRAVAARSGAAWAGLSPDEQLDRVAQATRPPVRPLFVAFRVMVGCGVLLLGVSALVFWHRHALARGGRLGLLRLLPWMAPLPWVATLSGWAVAEVGRQPWTVQGQLPTWTAAHLPPVESAAPGFFLMFVCGLLLAVVYVAACRFILRAGPDCDSLWRRLRPVGTASRARQSSRQGVVPLHQ